MPLMQQQKPKKKDARKEVDLNTIINSSKKKAKENPSSASLYGKVSQKINKST